MVIVGCGGLGKEILGILIQDGVQEEIIFYDENVAVPDLLYGKYRVIKDIREVYQCFHHHDQSFITGIGNPRIREKMTEKMEKSGGVLSSVISKRTSIFHFNEAYKGVIIQPGVGISHDVRLGKGAAIHINATIGHSSKIGRYVNIGPNASVIGPVEIGDYSYISAQSVVLPYLTIGKNVVVTAGKTVDRNLEDFETF